MKTKETIFQTFTRAVCSICKNKEKCQEELRRRTDGSVRCDSYERKNKL